MHTVFAFVACAYALSTLTDDWSVIAPVAAAWGLIIMTIDRALLSIYRSYQRFHRKVSQFFLRIVVAALMGITISHRLTHLLFLYTFPTTVLDSGQRVVGDGRLAGHGETGTVHDNNRDTVA